jgi:hypothetical protein
MLEAVRLRPHTETSPHALTNYSRKSRSQVAAFELDTGDGSHEIPHSQLRPLADAPVQILTSFRLSAGAEKFRQLPGDCKALSCHTDMRVARQ